MNTNPQRTGGTVLVETLEALGTEVVFGLPGVHALPIWDALHTSPIRKLVFRTELNAAFAAQAYAQTSGRPGVLIVSTGPGALISLAGVMEAATTHVPMLVIATQVPRNIQGRRRGYLHDLHDQAGSFAPLVKRSLVAQSAESLPGLLVEALTASQQPPAGPVYLGIPHDLLLALTRSSSLPPMQELAEPPRPAAQDVGLALEWLSNAERPVVWAGGGVLGGAAWAELAAAAEALHAPVLTTYMGKGAIPDDHPLAGGSGCEQAAYRELLEQADVILAVGTELGSETTAQYQLRLPERLIHADASAAPIGTTYPALPLVGDAKRTLATIANEASPCAGAEQTISRLAALRERISRGLTENGQHEHHLVEAIRDILPREAIHAWDSTILAYWAAEYFPTLEPRTYLYPLGSGTIGYAWPAALGAAAAHPSTPVLACVGDGGFAYGMAELATAIQYGLNVKLILVDDGGYGILRHYQRQSFGRTTSVDLHQPKFAELATSFGLPVKSGTIDSFRGDLEAIQEESGPAVLVLSAQLEAPRPTG